MIKTRQAVPIEDDFFLFEVYASSRQAEMALWGWEEEAQRQFLQMQHSCQQRSYQMQYANLECRIIMSSGVKAGRILTALTDDEMVLVDITLLANFQGQGIGSTLLKELQQKAAEAGLPVRLSVFEGNPAQRLYERMGFHPIGNAEPYTIMQWAKPKDELG